MDHDQSSWSGLRCSLERSQRRCHGRADSFRGFRLYQPQLSVRAWDQEVYFQTLLIAEIVEFLAHAAECTRCRQTYFDCLNVAGQQFARAKQNPTLSPKEMEGCIDSDLFVRRFLDRAEREGITFSWIHTIRMDDRNNGMSKSNDKWARAWWHQ